MIQKSWSNHQEFQVPKMGVQKYLILGFFGGWVFTLHNLYPYSLYKWVLPFLVPEMFGLEL